MNYYFLDTSAFVKAFVFERGERQVRGLIEAAGTEPPLCRLILTDLTFLEALSAILQRRDTRQITNRVCAAALDDVEELLELPQPYLVVQVSEVVREVPAIIRRHGLRPGDAVHIAGALRSRRSSAAALKMVFVTCDAKQERAATAEGLDVWNPAL